MDRASVRSQRKEDRAGQLPGAVGRGDHRRPSALQAQAVGAGYDDGLRAGPPQPPGHVLHAPGDGGQPAEGPGYAVLAHVAERPPYRCAAARRPDAGQLRDDLGPVRDNTGVDDAARGHIGRVSSASVPDHRHHPSPWNLRGAASRMREPLVRPTVGFPSPAAAAPAECCHPAGTSLREAEPALEGQAEPAEALLGEAELAGEDLHGLLERDSASTKPV